MVRIEFLVAVTSASMAALGPVHCEIRAILAGPVMGFFQRVTLQVTGSGRGNTSRLDSKLMNALALGNR
jgi:hypothetical protein